MCVRTYLSKSMSYTVSSNGTSALVHIVLAAASAGAGKPPVTDAMDTAAAALAVCVSFGVVVKVQRQSQLEC